MQRISEKVGRYPDDRPLVGSALLIISGLFLLRLGVGFQLDPEPLGVWIPPLLHSAVALSGGTIVLLRPARTRRVGLAILPITAVLLLVTRTVQVFWTPVSIIGALYCIAWNRNRATEGDRATRADTVARGERSPPSGRN